MSLLRNTATWVSAIEGKFAQCRTIANGQHAAGINAYALYGAMPIYAETGRNGFSGLRIWCKNNQPGLRAKDEGIMWVRIQLRICVLYSGYYKITP